jgi:DNA-binding transcriptional LysR family regulator
LPKPLKRNITAIKQRPTNAIISELLDIIFPFKDRPDRVSPDRVICLPNDAPGFPRTLIGIEEGHDRVVVNNGTFRPMNRTIKDADLNDYLYFAEAVAHGGFAAASRVLNIPKSKLSRRISGLESRLGVRLIERSTRHFRVTELGRSFYQRCRIILEVAEDAEAIVAEARSEPNGDVRFSCPTGLLEIVTPSLPNFMRQFPNVRLQMHAIDRPVDLIQEEIDLAIRVRTKLDDSTTLKMRSLGMSRKILVTNRNLAGTIDCDIAQLAKYPTLSTNEETREMEWTLIGPGGSSRKIKHDARMRCGDFSAIREAAVEGMGIALLPDHSCRDYLSAGKLVQVFPDWHSPDGFVHVVYTARRGLPAAARAFLDHLVSAFPPGILSSGDVKQHPIPSGAMKNGHVHAEAL